MMSLSMKTFYRFGRPWRGCCTPAKFFGEVICMLVPTPEFFRISRSMVSSSYSGLCL